MQVRSPRFRLLRAAPLALTVFSPDAWAQAPDAATLQRDLRAWIMGFLAPALVIAEPALTVVAADNGFDLAYPLGEKSDETVRLRMTPLPDGRWRVDQPRLPRKGEFAPPQSPSGAAVAFSVGEVQAHMTIDPTLKIGSVGRIEARDIAIASRSNDGEQTQRIEHYLAEGALPPRADGLLDVTQDASMTEWKSRTTLSDGVADNDVTRAEITLRVAGLRADRISGAFTTTKAMIADQMAAKPGEVGAMTPKLREQLRTVIESLRDLAIRIEAVETLHGYTGKIPGLGGFTIGKARLGIGGEAPDGKLRASAEMGVEGLEVEGLPKEWADYVPDRMEMRPVIIGVRTDRAIELLLRSLEDNVDGEQMNKDLGALLTTEGAWVGIEALLVDLDPLRVEGSGRLRMLGPDKPGIEARVTASGLEQLMVDMLRKPDTGMLVPILAMAKGLGRQEGDRVVWDIALTDSQVLINGVDLLAKPTEQPQRRPNRR